VWAVPRVGSLPKMEGMSRILTDADFDKLVLPLPLHQRVKLTVHNVVLQASLRDAEVKEPGGDAATRDRIVAWLLAQCGDADTVRANHARKLAMRIQAGEADAPLLLDVQQEVADARRRSAEGRQEKAA
jgi:hypothetical protein